jgi:hypothetical protein
MPEWAARTRKQGGRSRALWVDRHAERTLRTGTGQCRKQGHGANQARCNKQPDRVNSEHTKTSIPRRLLPAFTLKPSG